MITQTTKLLANFFLCLLSLFFLNIGHAQYCTSSANSAADGEIGGVTVNGATNLSNCNTTGGTGSTLNLYSDYTYLGTFTTLTAGATVNFSVDVTTCSGSSFQNGIAVYIDYNQNGSFTDPNETVYVTPNNSSFLLPGATLTSSFIVPNTITNGLTRMRVVLEESAWGANISPCGNYIWGETEDYTVMLTSPISATITDASCQGADGAIDVSFSAGTAPYTYSWSNGATTQDLQGVPMGAYSIVITDATGAVFQSTFYVNANNLTANETLVIPACFANNGAISLNPTGGTAPYTYQWSNGQTTNSIQNLPAGGYSVDITDANGCFMHKVFNLTLGTNCYVQIGGKAFYDVNNNCVWDLGEMGVPYTSLHLTKLYGGNYSNGTVTPANTGDYLIIADTGHYVLTANLPTSYMSIGCTGNTSYTLNMSAYGTDSLGLDFPINIPANAQDLVVNLTENVYVPGFNHHTYINYRNAGVVPVAATLTYHYDTILDSFTTSVPYTSIDTTARIITWNVGTLPALSNWTQIHLYAHIDTPQVIGTPVSSAVYINPTTNDITPLNNQKIDSTQVVAAFDPNYKAVSPVGLTQFGLVDATNTDIFHYTVHFQNTGNYPAQFVVIKDSIPAAFDIQSVLFEGSSHTCQISMTNDRELMFTFNDIFLPDSFTNEPASHGYVSFALKLKNNTPAFTTLKNKAAIYFDFNAPIITNEVQNVLYIFPTLDIPAQLTICETENVSTQVTGGQAPYQFVWSNGNIDNNNVSGLSSQAANSFIAGVNGLSVTDNYGYTLNQNFNLTTVAPVDATFSANLIAPNTYQFTPINTMYPTYSWNFGDGQNSTMMNPTHQYTGAGNYIVTLTATNFCGAMSVEKTIDITTALADETFVLNVKTYPNPFVEKIAFQFPNAEKTAMIFELTDNTGKLIEKFSTTLDYIELNTTHLTSGNYFWKLSGKYFASGIVQKK